MKAQALLLADDSAIRDWLSDALAGRVSVLPADSADAEGFAEEIATTPATSLVFVQFNDINAHERAGVVERVLARHPGLPVVAVGDRESSEAVLAAMRAGARDFLVVRRDDANLDYLIERILHAGAHSGGGSGGGGAPLYAVVSGSPTSAVPFLAAHLALGLDARSDGESKRVLLVDLSVPGGASLVFLDTEQSYSALDALRDVHRCDQTLIDTAFARYRESVYLLSLPEETVAPPDVDAGELGQLLDTFTGYFDAVVVAADSGIGLGALTTVVERARQAMLLVDQSVLRSRQNKHLLHALRQSDCTLEAMGLVIDNYQPAVGLEAQRLSELLELPHLASFSGRQRARINAMNAGEPMFEHAPRDPFCREVEALLASLTGESAPKPKRKGLLGRWFE